MTEKSIKLGFGTLRLPLFDKHDVASIDYDLLSRLVDLFLDADYMRFDTAYPYHDFHAETAVRRCLTSRYDRSRFELSTKMPMHLFESRDDLERIFAEQLKNCGVEYFDRYLLHNINASNIGKAEEFDAFGFLKAKKDAGLISEIGFSFHDSPEVLDGILTKHPVDFVLLQINYIDWEDLGIQSKRCYGTARRHGV
ncbi:MAG: aldo/keto reductase, partial [Methanomicrobium sp.]|nr:aldo/keto reductase [Methanomicrobium sp.]